MGLLYLIRNSISSKPARDYKSQPKCQKILFCYIMVITSDLLLKACMQYWPGYV